MDTGTQVNMGEAGTLLKEEEDVIEDGMIVIIGMDGKTVRIVQERVVI